MLKDSSPVGGQGLICQREISLAFHSFAVVSNTFSCYFIESATDYALNVAVQQLFGWMASPPFFLTASS